MLGLFSITAILGVLFLLWQRPQPNIPEVTAAQLGQAPLGSLVIGGTLQLESLRDYTRSYSILGKLQVEVLHVAPLTTQAWRPGDEVQALAIVRSKAPSALFHGPAVNLGPIDPSWKAPFPVSKNAILLELVPAEPPGWWLALGAFALLVFLGLAIRGVRKRIMERRIKK